MINVLLRIGIIARNSRTGKIDWPIYFAPRWVWRDWRYLRGWMRSNGVFYVFRNKPGVIKWIPGRLLPHRWGFGILGLIEIGDRGHGWLHESEQDH